MGYISPRNRYNNPLPQKGERHQQFRSETFQNVTILWNLKQLKESWLQLSSCYLVNFVLPIINLNLNKNAPPEKLDTQQNTRPVPHGCTVRLVDLAKFNDKPKSKRSKKGSQSPCLSDNIRRWMAPSHLEKDLLFFSSCTLSSTQPPVTLISPR